MLQSIEKKRQERPFEAVVTVMSHDRIHVLGGNGSLFAREGVALSLPWPMAVTTDVVSDASLQPGSLTLAQQTASRDRTRTLSLSHSENLFSEAPMARSALVVMAANPNRRSPQAAASVITTMAEQRCCVAA